MGTAGTARRSEVAARRPAPWRSGWGDLLGTLAIASLVLVVALWVTGGGIGQLVRLEPALGSLGLLTGLLSSDLMLLQLFLIARIPAAERAWGHDVLVRRHTAAGYWSFWLLMAHILLFLAQRLGQAGWSWATVYELFVHESWLLAATVGTVAIVLVVVTSVRAARRRLRYESWHLLHLYAYLGAGLALPHQIVDGADFRSPFAQAYWWTVWALCAGAIVVFRIALPAWRSAHHRLRVASVRRENAAVVSVVVEGNDLRRLHTASGQFFVWRFLDGPGWSRGNPYTISAAPGASTLRVTMKLGSERAQRLKPGTRVLIEGPYGSMVAERRRFPHAVLLAAGIGIAPIRALLEDMPLAAGEATLIARFSTETDALFGAEVTALAASRGIQSHELLGHRRDDDSWLPAGATGTDVAELLRLAPDVAESDIFVCGPPRWTKAVTRAALAAGAKRDQIHTEDFAW